MWIDVAYNLILILGSVQGLVLGLILWFNQSTQQQANRFLAALLFFWVYRLIAELLFYNGIASVENWMYHVLLEYNWVFGTLIYLYITAYLNNGFSLKKEHYIYFLPVFIEFCFSNFIKIQNFYWDGTRESISRAGYYGYILWMHTPFQLLVFSSLMLFFLFKARQELLLFLKKDAFVFANRSLQWLNRLIGIYAGFAILVMLVGLTDYLFFDYAFNPFYRFWIYSIMAVLTYWLALEGFGRRNLPAGYLQKRVDEEEQSKHQAVLEQVDKLMQEEKLFLQTQLNVKDVAEGLDVKPYRITLALNRGRQQTFTAYINKLRVEEAKKRILDEKNAQYTLLAIGLDCGFNSKATFNRAFKRFENLSPGEWKKSQLESH